MAADPNGPAGDFPERVMSTSNASKTPETLFQPAIFDAVLIGLGLSWILTNRKQRK